MAHLLGDMDAVAQGLSVMSSRILVDSLPSLVEELLGPREGSVIVARLLEKGAREGFTRFMERLGVSPDSMKLEQVLAIFVRQEGQQPRHPFQVFDTMECMDGKCVLESRRCPYSDIAERHPTVKAVFIGTVAGVAAALGYRVRWLVTPSARKYLCRESKPDIIIYMDENIELPACRLIVEMYTCSTPQS
ncbi:hypothetical protein [Pyrodictium abyssi]